MWSVRTELGLASGRWRHLNLYGERRDAANLGWTNRVWSGRVIVDRAI